LLKYFEGLLAIDARDRVKVLRYCFDHLDHKEQAVANDAYAEFIAATDPDIWKVARTLSADKLRRWLRDDRTASQRLRLYALLLAGCGKREDAVLLQKLLDELVKQEDPPLLDGILTGYTLLSPREGWAFTRELLKDPAVNWHVRHAALRSGRYFSITRPDVIREEEILAAFGSALEQEDIADIAVEYLRQGRCWKLTGKVLSIFNKKGFEAPVTRHSVVRYALQCPEAQAVRFIADLRKLDPSLVKEAEEQLDAGLVPRSRSRSSRRYVSWERRS
jgi:hypothetical protein